MEWDYPNCPIEVNEKQEKSVGGDVEIHQEPSAQPALYHAEYLPAAIGHGRPIIFTMDRPDADVAKEWGYPSTYLQNVSYDEWHDEYEDVLRSGLYSAHVVCIPKEEGHIPFLDRVCDVLKGYVNSFELGAVPNSLETGEGLAGLSSKGGTRADLERIVEKAYMAYEKEGLDASVENTAQQCDDSTSKPWDHIEHLPDFLANRTKMPEGIAEDTLYPGGVTLIAAPSGIGKSVVAHILARELAIGGVYRGLSLGKARVLLVDTDNPRSLVQDRLSKVCTSHNIDLHISSREKTRPLSDVKYWNDLPADKYDVVILDSFGGATPGISEKEGAKYQEAIAVVRNIADRGPAVLVLDNTIKSAENYRGRGEKAERLDIVYECHDVTRWEPTGAEWWLNLPDAGDNSWQERASRRHRTPKIRLAFIARKFRWGEEPVPFVLEVSFDTSPWSFEDITEQIDQ
jgi:hypothetical protein